LKCPANIVWAGFTCKGFITGKWLCTQKVPLQQGLPVSTLCPFLQMPAFWGMETTKNWRSKSVSNQGHPKITNIQLGPSGKPGGDRTARQHQFPCCVWGRRDRDKCLLMCLMKSLFQRAHHGLLRSGSSLCLPYASLSCVSPDVVHVACSFEEDWATGLNHYTFAMNDLERLLS
jgi:hypothetical protein